VIDQGDHLADSGPQPEPGSWQWLFADIAGVSTHGPSVSFTSQEAAEVWLQDNFEDLEDQGIATVSLMDGEHVVYGPMLLAADGASTEVAEAEL
jgi:hypothetical protein